MKKVAILQSNYIPWKGYFDMIALVDEFILYDDMQYTKNDWRNRNKLKTPNGPQWLSVPVGQDIRRRICDVRVDGADWQAKHWKTIEANYRRSKHFDEVASWLMPIYLGRTFTHLTQVNSLLIKAVCDYLGIKTRISLSMDYTLIEGKTERLVDLCLQTGATEYVSGPAARSYVDEAMFQDNGLKLTWFDYAGYPDYPQLWGEFTHGVTILDLLFNCGKDSCSYMRYVK
ncbi:WbqC family protein [Neorhizobium sp. NPDC001467]|uniref:WbqC family protein n=1 Tax=Neorhizobium sp. NPDC001467 TaxID=3390595 RepID=UPI003CFC49A8